MASSRDAALLRRFQNLPSVLVLTTCAVASLVPGLPIFRAPAHFGQQSTRGLLSLATVAATALALATGVLLGSCLSHFTRDGLLRILRRST